MPKRVEEVKFRMERVLAPMPFRRRGVSVENALVGEVAWEEGERREEVEVSSGVIVKVPGRRGWGRRMRESSCVESILLDGDEVVLSGR
jgi:hypothetical protein